MCSVLLCAFRSAHACVCGGVFVDVLERASVPRAILSVYKDVCECVRALVRLHRRLGGVSTRRCWRIVRRVGRRLRTIAHRRSAPPALCGRQTRPTVQRDTRPTRESRSSADAVGDAASGPVGGPNGAAAAATACARRAHTRTPQLLQRAGVCARACACRWCCRSRRWPAGKLCDYQVLGVLEVLADTVRVSPALRRYGASRG